MEIKSQHTSSLTTPDKHCYCDFCFLLDKWLHHLCLMNVKLYYYSHLKEMTFIKHTFIQNTSNNGSHFWVYKGKTFLCYQDSNLHPGAELSWS